MKYPKRPRRNDLLRVAAMFNQLAGMADTAEQEVRDGEHPRAMHLRGFIARRLHHVLSDPHISTFEADSARAVLAWVERPGPFDAVDNEERLATEGETLPGKVPS